MSRATRTGASVVLWLIVWQAVSTLAGPGLLPSPVRVAARLGAVLAAGGPRGRSALYHFGWSFARVAAVVTLGLVLSTALGLAMAFDERVEAAVSVWLPAWLTVPTLVVILVTMVLFDFSELSVVLGVTFVATPFATVNTWEGARAVDRGLLEMAAAFDAGRWAVLRHVYLPATLPQVVGSLRYLLGMVWKVVVLAETFGTSEGLGSAVRYWFNQGDITAILAYLSLFVAAMLAVQFGIRALSERLFAWQS
jgi:NitT/TauT family transport system permease protein